jgi:hypothetical protein
VSTSRWRTQHTHAHYDRGSIIRTYGPFGIESTDGGVSLDDDELARDEMAPPHPAPNTPWTAPPSR